MPTKTGLKALLRPEDSVLVLIDHQPFQFANLHSHDPTQLTTRPGGPSRAGQ
jgi:hypothetical protein